MIYLYNRVMPLNDLLRLLIDLFTCQSSACGKIATMNYEELKRQIGKAGLTNTAFAELIGIHPKSVTNFKVKGVPPNIAIIAVLIAEMKERGIDFENIIKSIGLK